MPLFDIECKVCGKVQEDVWLKVNESPPECSECSVEMQKIINCRHFKLLYDPKKDSCSWAFDGYNSSQYWKDVKAARDRGEKVKGCDEV